MATPELKTYSQSFDTGPLGQIFLTGILNVEAFSKVNLQVIQSPKYFPTNMTAVCEMGKFTGEPFSGEPLVQAWKFPLDTQILTFEVIGPEFSVKLTGGPPFTSVSIRAWVFLN
jgi:hypothetical protein